MADLRIVNISPTQIGPGDLNTYSILLRGEELATFRHVAEHGATECLRLAWEALAARDGGPPNSLQRHVMRRRRERLLQNLSFQLKRGDADA